MSSPTANLRSAASSIKSLGERKPGAKAVVVNTDILVYSGVHSDDTQAVFQQNATIFDKSFSLYVTPGGRDPLIFGVSFGIDESGEAAKALIASPESDVHLTTPPLPMRLILTWPGVMAEATLRPATLRQAMQAALAMKDAVSKGGWKQEKMTWKWDVEGAAGKRGASKGLREVAKVIDATKRPCFERTSQAVEKTEKVVEGADAEEENEGQIQEKMGEFGMLAWLMGLLWALLRSLRLIR